MVAPPPAFFSGPLPWAILAVATVFFLWVDLHFFARGRVPSFREGVIWSIGWLVVSLLAAVVVWILSDADDAITYTTVYFIERSTTCSSSSCSSRTSGCRRSTGPGCCSGASSRRSSCAAWPSSAVSR
jgi:hypothetical protein